MSRFLLGKEKLKSAKTVQYGIGTNNFVEFMIPHVLSAIDLDNFIAILNEFNKHYSFEDLNKKDFLDITGMHDWEYVFTLTDLARSLSKSYSTAFNWDFLASLKRICSVIMSYKKRIDKSDKVHVVTMHLMQYHANKCNKNIVGIRIKLNPFTFAIMKKSTLNYSLIN